MDFGEGNDPTGGANPGDSTGTAPAPSAPVTPAVPSGGATPPAFTSVTDLAKAWGKPFTLDELRTLYPAAPLHDQASVDKFVQDRLRRERAQNDAVINNLREEFQRRLAAGGKAPDGAPPQPNPELSQFRNEMEDVKLDRTIEKLTRKYPDFEANENDILLVAYENRVGPEAAYKLWKYDNHYSKMDLKEIEKRAVDKYLAEKTGTAATTPTPQGSGGSAPVAANKHDGSFETADRRAKARIEGREP